MSTRNMLMAAISVLLLTPHMPALAAGKTGGTLSAAVEFRAPALGADGDRIDGDGLAAYVDGQNKASVKIDSDAHNNDIVMDLSRTRGGRGVFVDLSDCADAACDGRPFDQIVVWDGVRMQTRAARLLDFALGETRPVRLWLHFVANGAGWWLRLDAEDRETDCSSHSATATRTAQNEWVIGADAGQVACLLTITDAGKEARGRFRIPHQFTVRVK